MSIQPYSGPIPVVNHPLMDSDVRNDQEAAAEETESVERGGQSLANVTSGPVQGSRELPVILVREVRVQELPVIVVASPVQQVAPAANAAPRPRPLTDEEFRALEEIQHDAPCNFMMGAFCLMMSFVPIYLTYEMTREPVPTITTVVSLGLFACVSLFFLREYRKMNALVNRALESQNIEVSRTARAVESIFQHGSELC